LVNRGFTRMIKALEPRIREMAVRILDRAVAKQLRFRRRRGSVFPVDESPN
jgi:hypothetical protein